MFDVEDRSWIARSAVALSAEAEIAFVLQPIFHSDPNALDDKDVITLPRPTKMATEPHFHSSKEVLDDVQGLLEHYRAVLKLAQRFGQSYVEFNHYMWLRLQFAWSKGTLSFAWYDTLKEMALLFDWLRDASDGQLWSDVEQGWEMIAVRVGTRFHFRQGGFDQGEEYINVSLPREDLLASITDLRDRMRIIIGRLTADLGEDYWTQHRYDLRTDLR